MESSPWKLFVIKNVSPEPPSGGSPRLFLRAAGIWLASLAILLLGNLVPAAQAQLAPGTILMTDDSINSLIAVDPATGDRVRFSGGLVGNPGFPLIGSGFAFSSPGDPALLPSGLVIVADGNLDRLVEVDPVTGDRSTYSGPGKGLGPFFTFPSRFDFNAVTGVVYVNDSGADAVFAVDPVTRNRSIISDEVVGSGPLFDQISGMALADTDTLVVCDLNRDALFEVQISTGARTIFSGDPSGVNIGSGPLPNSSHLAILPGGDVIMNSLDEDVIIRVNRTTGNRTVVSGPGVGSGPALDLPNGGIAIADAGSIYVGEQDLTGILKIDLATGNRTIVTSNSGVGSGASFISPNSIYAIPMIDTTVFADGFESGDASAWTLVVQ